MHLSCRRAFCPGDAASPASRARSQTPRNDKSAPSCKRGAAPTCQACTPAECVAINSLGLPLCLVSARCSWQAPRSPHRDPAAQHRACRKNSTPAHASAPALVALPCSRIPEVLSVWVARQQGGRERRAGVRRDIGLQQHKSTCTRALPKHSFFSPAQARGAHVAARRQLQDQQPFAASCRGRPCVLRVPPVPRAPVAPASCHRPCALRGPASLQRCGRVGRRASWLWACRRGW